MLELLILLGVLLALAFCRANLAVSGAVLAALAFAFLIAGDTPPLLLGLNALLAVALLLLSHKPLRVFWVSRHIYRWFRKLLPKLSDTEQEALEAGTIWWDAQLFSGQPDWNKLLTTPRPTLSPREQAFLDGPVEQLCAMLDSWEIKQRKDLPEEVWQFMRREGFFGLIIDGHHGGHDFSPQANSAIVGRIASCDLTAAITVMVPNSLGPGELLRDFGTAEQRDYYLPRLANGEDIPCFALTGPSAGSDASSMPDRGIVCRGEWNGEQVLGLRVSWNKRYITLAPVATVLGLAFRAFDPEGLLGGEEELGITCALIPTDTPGVETGNRHFPVGAVFMNGPTRGEDVFIPMDYIIGGQERIGQGWRMLMHSLAAGRAISLPALGTAGVKYSARYSGEYARVRKQFGLPIAYFEGIEEPLARMAGEAYRLDAARLLTLSALDMGEQPAVLSALLKYHATEANRRCVNDAMDIHGGKGIITGPGNYLADLYTALPIAITVEGANILSRSMIIYGQGAIRNHPYLRREIELGQAETSAAVIQEFDKTLFRHLGFTITNAARAFCYGITGGRLIKSPVKGRTAHYYRQLTRLSTVFALVTDLVLSIYGGGFKFREKISGRMADVLTHLYLASAVLKRYEDQGCRDEDRALVHWAIRDSLYQIQGALVNTLRNLRFPLLGRIIQWWVFPLGRPYKEPSDRLGKYAARVLITDSPARTRLLEGLYEFGNEDIRARLSRAFNGLLAINTTEKLLRKRLSRPLTIDNYAELLEEARASALITDEQADQIEGIMSDIRAVINVDDFPADSPPVD